jgi:hypothetical protein
MKLRFFLLMLAVTALAAAQNPRSTMRLEVQGGQVGVMSGPAGELPPTFEFMWAESFAGRPVKGAPYSAESVTESTQMLMDGNRIYRKSSTKLYRDSQGRTRREQNLEMIGPWAASGEPRQVISINDPVADVSYSLDPQNRTAHKSDVLVDVRRRVETLVDKKVAEAGERRERPPRLEGPIRVEGGNTFAVAGGIGRYDSRNAVKEDLGKREFEGVVAEGTRITHTIPAGQIGNDLPINIVSETWYAPELQMTVYSKRSDPRTGETVTRLINIRREEQPKSLFEVPADYTLKEASRFKVVRPKEEI